MKTAVKAGLVFAIEFCIIFSILAQSTLAKDDQMTTQPAIIVSPASSEINTKKSDVAKTKTTQTTQDELSSLKKQDLVDYCQNYLDQSQKCPNDVCAIGCEGGVVIPGCRVTCEPRPCFELSLKDCPTDSCQILKGCGGRDVCYPRLFDQSPPTCGSLAYPGDAVACCEGLVKRCGVEFFDRSCDMIGQLSIYSVPICLPCGNGICNQFENHCNCPEDCP